MASAAVVALLSVLSCSAVRANGTQQNYRPEEQAAAFRSAVCSKGYSLSCLKLDLVGLVARTGGGGKYQLLPGVFFSHNLSTTPPDQELLSAVRQGNATNEIEGYISSTVNDYLSSLTLSVKVLDSSTLNHARKLSEHILTNFIPMETGRKKGYGGAVWAAGTLAAVGMAALAAISGKAMMASMLALMMAGVSALRNGNGNGSGSCKSAHYIDTHARAIEPEGLAAVEPIEVVQSLPIYNSPHSALTPPQN